MQKLIIFISGLLLLVSLDSCKKSKNAPTQPQQVLTQLAYIYQTDSTDGETFKSLLAAYGFAVTLVERSAVSTFDYSACKLIIIGTKSSSPGSPSNGYNSAAFTGWSATDSASIQGSGKPLLLMGEAGSLYASRINNAVNYGSEAFGDGTTMIATDTPAVVYQNPVAIVLPANHALDIYAAASSAMEFYFAGPVPNVVLLGADSANTKYKYCPVSIEAGRYGLWGYENNMTTLTLSGQAFLVNFVYYLTGLNS